MPTEHPACREADSAGSNRRAEAPWNKPASRSVSEPKVASLRQVRAANLSDVPKPEIRREAMFTSSGGVLRSEWGQRAGKVGLGRLGDPYRRPRDRRDKACVESIRQTLEVGGVGEARSSDEAG